MVYWQCFAKFARRTKLFDMLDLSEFESISPYTDEEAAEALNKLAEFPLLSKISQQFFPEETPDFLQNLLRSINKKNSLQKQGIFLLARPRRFELLTF